MSLLRRALWYAVLRYAEARVNAPLRPTRRGVVSRARDRMTKWLDRLDELSHEANTK